MTQTTEKKSLDEALAERRAEEEEVVLDIRVNDEYKLECETNDGWETACELRELPNHSFDDNTKVIESARQSYQELQTKVDSVLNDDGYWELEYRYGDDRESDTLVVPLATSITDDVLVYEIHDEELNPKDEYVELIESEDLERSDTLYTKYLSKKSVYNIATKKKNIEDRGDEIVVISALISFITLTVIFSISISSTLVGRILLLSLLLTPFLALPIFILFYIFLSIIYLTKTFGYYTDYERVL